MEITQAQKDVRDTFLGGFAGQLVSAVLWGTSAAACTWHSLHLGEIILVLGGFLIFPVTQLLLRSLGHGLCASEGTSDERARYPGRLHLAADAPRGNRPCSSSTCMVLSSSHDHCGSSLFAVRIHVRDVAICRPVRNPGHEWCRNWNVSAKAAESWRLAYSNATLPLRLRRPTRGAAQLTAKGVVMRMSPAYRQVWGQ